MRALLLFLCLAFSTLRVRAEAPFEFDKTPGALPKTIVPHHYRLELEPDIEKLSTHGTAEIELEVREPVTRILLNASEIQIQKAALEGGTNLKVAPDSPKGTLTLEAPEKIPQGRHTLRLEFESRINEKPSGLYYVDYPSAGKTARMLVTQMEAADARSVIPCWDEPVFRAVFELTLRIPEKLTAFSNMPIVSEEATGDGRKVVRFQPTPSMSSYLLAFAIGDFEVLRDEVEGISIGIVTPAGKSREGRYALEATRRLIPYFNDYFGVRYPLPKLDQIAVPHKGGAMENWGLITYDESLLLFDESRSSNFTRERIFGVVAHEIAHQWFGNLVTMAWWDNLWLNEGFASWMSTKASDHFHPAWQKWLRSNGDKEWAMSLDSKLTTHPIQQPVPNVAAALDMFDAISYQKGQALIRMLEDYVGANAFRAGLRAYVAKHSGSNTTTADLWNALESASGQPVRVMAEGWTEQPGFPVIGVSCEPGGPSLKFRQERFTVGNPDPDKRIWRVPVRLLRLGDKGKTQTFLLEKEANSLPVPDCDGTWLANAGGTGYYRVEYSEELASRIATQLSQLPAEDRLTLLSDAWALFVAGRKPVGSYLSFTAELKSETTQAVVSQILGSLGAIDYLLRGTNLRTKFRSYARSLVRPQLQRLGQSSKPGEPPTNSLLRSELIGLMGEWEDPEILALARKQFRTFQTNRSSIPPDLRWAMLAIAGKDSGAYDALKRLAQSAENTEERDMFYQALCRARDPEHAKRTLAMAEDPSLPPRVATSLVSGVAWGGDYPELAWEYATSHFESLRQKLGSLEKNSYFPSLATALPVEIAARELKAFQAAHLGPDEAQAVKKALADIAQNADLKRRLLEQLPPLLESACRDKPIDTPHK